MKKLLCVLVFVIMVLGTLVACEGGMIPNPDNNGNNGNSAPKEDVITVEDGYLVVNGVKTEHKVHTEPTLSVIDGYVAVNGVKTEYKVDVDDVITVVDGYLVVNGKKTEFKVDTPDVIEIIDGYVVVNGVKTDIFVPSCNHSWTTVTTAPTCTAGGYDTKTCSLCGKSIVENETAKLDHIYSTSYSFDDTHHWYGCTGCDAEKDKSTHTPDDDGICTVCQTPISATPGVIYDVSADGTYAEVIGYEGTATKVKIASEYNGLPVKNIYNNAFMGKNITDVVIPDSVTSIGDLSFASCTNLNSVVIGNGVTNIGYSAFSWCTNLNSLMIGNSVMSIGERAFYNCYSIGTLVIPDSVKTIGTYAFAFEPGPYRYALNSVVIGSGVTSIGDGAFYYCSSLTSVVIGDNVKSIGSNAFGRCGLEYVSIPDSVVEIDKTAFNLYVLSYNEYDNCKYLGNEDNPYLILIDVVSNVLSRYTIHSDTKVIAGGAFDDCSRMTNLVIPKNVKFINGAFDNCQNLTDVYYVGTELEWKDIMISNLFANHYLLNVATIHYNYVP